MTLTDPRLTRSAAATGSGAGETTRTVAPLARGRMLVRLAVWATATSRALGSVIRAAADWASSTVRPAGVLAALAAIPLLVAVASALLAHQCRAARLRPGQAGHLHRHRERDLHRARVPPGSPS